MTIGTETPTTDWTPLPIELFNIHLIAHSNAVASSGLSANHLEVMISLTLRTLSWREIFEKKPEATLLCFSLALTAEQVEKLGVN